MLGINGTALTAGRCGTEIAPRGMKPLTAKQIKETRSRYKKLAQGRTSKKEEVRTDVRLHTSYGGEGLTTLTPGPQAKEDVPQTMISAALEKGGTVELDLPEGYPFGHKDDLNKNIILDFASGPVGRPVVKCATLEKLVERLTYAKYSGTYSQPSHRSLQATRTDQSYTLTQTQRWPTASC